MRHLAITDVALRLVRKVACTQCDQRPTGSAALGPEVSRACEVTCPLFLHLPALVRLAGEVGDASGACDAVLKESVCGGCRLSPTAGEFCAEYSARACPLSRYGADVLDALRRVTGRTPGDAGPAERGSAERGVPERGAP